MAKPVARTVADLGAGLGPASDAADRDYHRPALLYRLRPAIRTGDPRRRRVVEASDLRLAYRASLDLPAQSGPACGVGADPDSSRDGQAVVSDTAAVRVATRQVDSPITGTDFAADAGRRDPVRNHHRRAQHPVRLHLR